MLHKATGEHFNKPGHKISDMIMTIIEKVHSDDPMVLSVREEHWIKKGNTKYKGINRNKGWKAENFLLLAIGFKNIFGTLMFEDKPGVGVVI